MDPFNQIAEGVMSSVLSRNPRGFQLPSIAHIVKMMSGEIPCGSVLLVQPTGTRKSSVPLTCAVIDYGVTVVVENTLSLGIDQAVNLDSTQLWFHSANI